MEGGAVTILWIITAWILLDRVLRCLISWVEYCEARELDRLEWLEGDNSER